MIEAKVVCDSVSSQDKRLASVEIVAHRFILAEINTHRMLSRSYRSSRAVPSKRLIEEVRTNPAMPVFWGANEPGMQANGQLVGYVQVKAHGIWRAAAREAANHAEAMAQCGLHKQIANRVLEPFLWARGIITATEWDNFFGLRLNKSAQPEFRALADAMWAAMKSSTPKLLKPGEWHLPYVDASEGLNETAEPWFGQVIKRSVARCARNSYNSFDTGKRSTLDEDLATYAKLNIPGTDSYDPAEPIHASPAEHQGAPDEYTQIGSDVDGYANQEEHGNFVGWRQYRKTLPGEAVAPLPKEYAE